MRHFYFSLACAIFGACAEKGGQRTRPRRWLTKRFVCFFFIFYYFSRRCFVFCFFLLVFLYFYFPPDLIWRREKKGETKTRSSHLAFNDRAKGRAQCVHRERIKIFLREFIKKNFVSFGGSMANAREPSDEGWPFLFWIAIGFHGDGPGNGISRGKWLGPRGKGLVSIPAALKKRALGCQVVHAGRSIFCSWHANRR